MAAATLYAVTQAWHWGPYRDMWIAMDFIRAAFEGTAGFGDYFALHGGAHRLLVPRLLYLVDYGVFSGSNIFLMMVGALVQLGVVVLVCCGCYRDPRLTSPQRVVLLSLAVLLMLNPLQLENFLYSFDVQWLLTGSAAAAALYFLVHSFQDEKPTVWRLGLAAGAAAISMFSSFSGVCVWLLLPVVVWIFRRNPWCSLLCLILAAVVIGVYTRGAFGDTTKWISMDGSVTISNVLHFMAALAFLLGKWCILYLGSPLGREFFWGAALCVLASGAVVGYYGLRLLRHGARGFSSFEIWCWCLAAFAASVALATGWGRMHFMNTADEDRYQSIVALYWLGVFGLLVARAHAAPYRLASAAWILLWTLWVIPYSALQDMRAQLNQFDRVNTANLAIATGQWEFQAIKSTLILGDKIKEINRPVIHAPFLQEKQWGVFATEGARQLGQHFVPDDAVQPCEGQLFSLAPLGESWGGYQLSGQAYDPVHQRPLSDLRITDDQGQVVGLGRLQRAHNSLLPIQWQARENARWTGYTVPLRGEVFLQVWGHRADGHWCRAGAAKLTRHSTRRGD